MVLEGTDLIAKAQRSFLPTATQKLKRAVEADLRELLERAADEWLKFRDEWASIPEDERPSAGDVAAVILAAKRVHERTADRRKRGLLQSAITNHDVVVFEFENRLRCTVGLEVKGDGVVATFRGRNNQDATFDGERLVLEFDAGRRRFRVRDNGAAAVRAIVLRVLETLGLAEERSASGE